MKLFNEIRTSIDFSAITFCVIGQACSNSRLLAALDDRYAYENLQNDDEIRRKLSETKILLSKRQLRIYVVQSFDEPLFNTLKEDENSYIISAELVLTCAEKKIVTKSKRKRRKKPFRFLQDIPVPRRNRPLYSQHLSSAVICFVGGTRREVHVRNRFFFDSNFRFVFRRNSAISFIISADLFERITVIK